MMSEINNASRQQFFWADFQNRSVCFGLAFVFVLTSTFRHVAFRDLYRYPGRWFNCNRRLFLGVPIQPRFL